MILKYSSNLALPILGGFLLGLSLLGGRASIVLAIAALATLVSAIGSQRFPLRSHLAFGSTAAATCGYWVPDALQTLGATPIESAWGFAIAILWTAIPGFAFLGLVVRMTRDWNRLAAAIAYSVALAGIETALLTLPNTVPWVLVGYSAIGSAGLRQLAFAGGVPLVSVTLNLCAWAGVEIMRRNTMTSAHRAAVSILVGTLFMTLLGEPFARASTPSLPANSNPIRFVAIQPAIPRGERLRPSLQALNVDRLVAYSRHALETLPPDRIETILVWPENAIIETSRDTSTARDLAAGAATSLRTRLLLGVTRQADHAPRPILRNSVFSLGTDGTLAAMFDKHRAVPAIESNGMGSFERFARSAIGAAGHDAKVASEGSLSPVGHTGGAIVALCFEILFPELASARRPLNASVILNPADDSWIESPVVSRQLMSIARFRAIEQRLPLIRVAHGGLSAHYDAYGRLVERLPLDRYGSLAVDVKRTNAPTAYARILTLALPIGSGGLAWWAYPIVAHRRVRRRLDPADDPCGATDRSSLSAPAPKESAPNHRPATDHSPTY